MELLKLSMLRSAVLLALLVVAVECRRVRLKPPTSQAATASNEQQEEEAALTRQVIYYQPEEQNQSSGEEEQQPVIIGRSRQSNGYGRAIGGPQLPSSGASAASSHSPRVKSENAVRSPPVQTIRNFNKLNDDGSFTFGYEAADGSFKEETRGVDCVVRGKYGYVDPDGNKREFTYVSGNPCDPNAISQEEDEEFTGNRDKSNEEENIPQNIPRRPPPPPSYRPAAIPTARPKPATTYFQQNFITDEQANQEEDEQDNQLRLNVKHPVRPIYKNNLLLTDEETQPQNQIVRTSTSRPKFTYQPSASTVVGSTGRLIGRPVTGPDSEEPATTYRPQIVQLPITATPATTLYARQSPRPAYIATPTPTSAGYFDEQFKKFQLDSNLIPSQGPITKSGGLPPNSAGSPIYSTELVYDPATGQYNTIVYQQVPKLESGISLRQKLPFVSSTTTSSSLPPKSLLIGSSTTQSPLYQQQLIQQQQANQVQQSQQLYNLQLKQQQVQRFPPSPPTESGAFVKPPAAPLRQHNQPPIGLQRFPPSEPKQFAALTGDAFPSYPIQQQQQQQQPSFYYLNPAVADDRQNLAAGQIEAFLRGHNLSF